MRAIETLVDKREAVRKITNRHGVERVRLFGSHETGEGLATSDVDLLVKLESARDLLDLAGFKLDMEELLGRKVDVVEEEGFSPYLKGRIMNEAMEI